MNDKVMCNGQVSSNGLGCREEWMGDMILGGLGLSANKWVNGKVLVE